MPDWGVDGPEIWASEQLDKSRLPEPVRQGVTRLLQVWRTLPNITGDTTNQILYVFSELAQDHALAVPDENFTWVPVRPGQIKVGDIVRTKLDAYPGDAGKYHNGRISRVVAIRSGDIITRTIDNGPLLDGAHHSPFALDKRIPLL